MAEEGHRTGFHLMAEERHRTGCHLMAEEGHGTGCHCRFLLPRRDIGQVIVGFDGREGT